MKAMLMNRRQFLGLSGATALVATCYPNITLGHALLSHPQQSSAEMLKSMQGLLQQKNLLLGYPINMTTPPEEFFAWRKELFAVGLNQFGFNNVGNPYAHSHVPFNSHLFERELINRFGAVYGFSQDNIWGFLSNSGTDSNMHGLYWMLVLINVALYVHHAAHICRDHYLCSCFQRTGNFSLCHTN